MEKEVIGYGIGQYFETFMDVVLKKVNITYLCDANWEKYMPEYRGIPVISPDEARKHKDALFCIFSGNERSGNSIKSMLDEWGVEYVHAGEYISLGKSITGAYLKQSGFNGHYEDEYGNVIDYAVDIPDSLSIIFKNTNNHVVIAPRVTSRYFVITCGKDSVCTIGESTEVVGMEIYVSYGEVCIGQDCLMSSNVEIRNADGHHLFSKKDGTRINGPKNISIGNHVWIGKGAVLLGDFSIGDNSVVGTMAVSSSKFPSEVVIAGNPAKIIRENVCWTRDSTDYFNISDICDSYDTKYIF